MVDDDPWQAAPWAREQVAEARRAILITTGPDGRPRPVPCTFALVGDHLISAVDHKPKTTRRLARLADLDRTGRATVLVDHYDDDWSALWWVRIHGPAGVVPTTDDLATRGLDALQAKYPPYADRRPEGPVWAVEVEEVVAWRAAG